MKNMNYVILMSFIFTASGIYSMKESNEAFIRAVKDGDLHKVKTLILEQKADVNYESDKDDYNPLALAVLGNNPEIVQFLLEHHAAADQNFSSLVSAARNGSLAIVQMLIRYGADTNVNNSYSIYNPLTIAAYKNYTEIVRFLLVHGADTKIIDDQHKTALHWAVYNRNPEMVKLLLEHGANMDAADSQGKTPLMLAHKKNYTEIVNILERYAAAKKEVGALLADQHPRIGSGSPANTLTEDDYRRIWQELKKIE